MGMHDLLIQQGNMALTAIESTLRSVESGRVPEPYEGYVIIAKANIAKIKASQQVLVKDDEMHIIDAIAEHRVECTKHERVAGLVTHTT